MAKKTDPKPAAAPAPAPDPAPEAVRIHPIAEIFPKPTEEEYAATMASVRMVGFRQPAILWRAPDGLDYVIDGRTRYAIRDELARNGIRKADNGALLEPATTYFVGTEREALEHVRATHHRRNLSSSQKAGVAVKAGAMLRRLEAKEKGEEAGELKAEEAGRLAERVAATAGTNRQYVYDVAALHQTNPDLVDMIVQGAITVPQAKQAAKRREDGKPAFPADDEKPAEVPVTSKPVEVYDALRRRVHPDFAETFAARKEAERIDRELGKLLKDAQALADGPGGRLMVFSTIKADINNGRKHLKSHKPHIVCPSCAGTGDSLADPGQKCGTCEGRRYIDKLQYDALPEDVRAKLEADGDGGAAQAAADAAEHAENAGQPAAAGPETTARPDPDATSTREFAPGEMTPADWDADPADVAAVAAELPDGDPSADPALTGAAAAQPAPAASADDDDPFAL